MNFCCCCCRKRKSCDSSPTPSEASPKEESPSPNEDASSCDSEEEKVLPRYGMKNLEIREWRVELKENELNLQEGDIKAKRRKLREMKESVECQQQDQDQKTRELEEKKNELDEREANVERQKENLRRLHFEINEKNAIMEIVLKLENRTEKLSINLSSDSPSFQTSGSSSSPTSELLLQERVREVEEREANLRRIQENLDQREIQLEEKRMILDIAIRINDFSNESKLLALTDGSNPGDGGQSCSNNSSSESGSGSSSGSGTGSNERISSAGEENSESMGNSS